MSQTMSEADLAALFADPVAERLLAADFPARLAYTGTDGSPRVIPIGWDWHEGRLRMWTIPGSAKTVALERDPRVAVTLDTNDFPPNVLLVRGTAELEELDGVPQGYLDAGHKNVGDDQYDEWAAGVKDLYDSMVEIRITPTWAKILDFDTRLPSDVERKIREKSGKG